MIRYIGIFVFLLNCVGCMGLPEVDLGNLPDKKVAVDYLSFYRGTCRITMDGIGDAEFSKDTHPFSEWTLVMKGVGGYYNPYLYLGSNREDIPGNYCGLAITRNADEMVRALVSLGVNCEK